MVNIHLTNLSIHSIDYQEQILQKFHPTNTNSLQYYAQKLEYAGDCCSVPTRTKGRFYDRHSPNRPQCPSSLTNINNKRNLRKITTQLENQFSRKRYLETQKVEELLNIRDYPGDKTFHTINRQFHPISKFLIQRHGRPCLIHPTIHPLGLVNFVHQQWQFGQGP